MTRMVCKHLVPIDMECADCKLEWLGDESEKDAEIKRLRAALKEAAEIMDGEGLAAADDTWRALGLLPPHKRR